MKININDLELREIKALRKSLNFIPLTGIDAMFIALLQTKISTHISKTEEKIKKEEIKSSKDLKIAIKNDPEIKN
mgnify:FL=1|tara:strand:- start:2301 stop:2525 length:225 start_codon:yes stop_codon:yes gene_type:complete